MKLLRWRFWRSMSKQVSPHRARSRWRKPKVSGHNLKNRRTMKKLIATACLGMLLTACSKDEQTQPATAQRQATFTAQTEGAGNTTRTNIDENRNILWTANDQINIFEKNTVSKKYRVSEGAGTTKAKFTYDSGEPTGTPLAHNIAIYPFNGNNPEYNYTYEVENGTQADTYTIKNLVIPQNQYYAGNDLPAYYQEPNSLMPMVGVSAGNGFAFKNLCGVIKLQIYNEISIQKIREIKVSKIGGGLMAGLATAVVGADGTVKSFEVNQGGYPQKDNISLQMIPAVLPSTDPNILTDFYILVPPTDYPQGIEIRISDEGWEHSSTYKTKPCTIGRNQMMVMPPLKFIAGTWGTIEDVPMHGA